MRAHGLVDHQEVDLNDMTLYQHEGGVGSVRRGATLMLLAIALATSYSIQTAQAQVGGAAVVFLKIEPDSRAAGMGNAGVALADNVGQQAIFARWVAVLVC